MAGNPKHSFRRCVGCLVCDDGRICDGFNQTRSENRRWDAEDKVILSCCGSEIRLSDVALSRVGASGNREQCLNASAPYRVRRWIYKFEPGFTDGSVVK